MGRRNTAPPAGTHVYEGKSCREPQGGRHLTMPGLGQRGSGCHPLHSAHGARPDHATAGQTIPQTVLFSVRGGCCLLPCPMQVPALWGQRKWVAPNVTLKDKATTTCSELLTLVPASQPGA